MVFLFFSLFFLFFFSLKKGGDILKNKRNFSVEKIHEKCLFFYPRKMGFWENPFIWDLFADILNSRNPIHFSEY